MKKTAIVTVYNACNYGSFLQAYGLKSFLENEGECEVSFVYIPINENKIISADVFSAEYTEYEKMKYDRLVENQRVFKVVDNTDESYVCTILGSDTIWNMFDRSYAKIPYFVGKGLNNSHIISYAASVGQPNLIKLLVKKGIKLLPVRKLDKIAVRDDNTEKVVRLLGRKAVRVLDPTFLWDFGTKKPDCDIPDDYVLVYTYGLKDDEIRAVKTYADKCSLTVIATGSLCTWADMNLAVDSFEWLWLVKNAAAVVTGTFHGTVFSIKYNKQFASLTSGSSKVESLLRELGLSGRICNAEHLSDVLGQKLSYNEVNKLIKKRTAESKKYLLDNIGE